MTRVSTEMLVKAPQASQNPPKNHIQSKNEPSCSVEELMNHNITSKCTKTLPEAMTRRHHDLGTADGVNGDNPTEGDL